MLIGSPVQALEPLANVEFRIWLTIPKFLILIYPSLIDILESAETPTMPFVDSDMIGKVPRVK